MVYLRAHTLLEYYCNRIFKSVQRKILLRVSSYMDIFEIMYDYKRTQSAVYLARRNDFIIAFEITFGYR